MIKRLQRQIFWIVELLPITILLLVLIAYNVSYANFIVNDEKETLEYCASCVEKYSIAVDDYFSLSLDELINENKSRANSSTKLSNLLHAIISTDLIIVKMSGDGTIIENTFFEGEKLELKNLVQGALSEHSESGRIKEMLFSVVDKGNQRYLIMLDTSDWDTSINKARILSALGLIIAAIIFAFAARFVSNKTVQPVRNALEKQNRFIADASHELKTPLSVINANISVLEREFGENKWMKYIKDEGHGMNVLINELLDLSKIDFEINEKQNNKITPEKFELSETLMEAALPFDSIAFENEKSISIDCPNEHECVGFVDDFKKIIAILIDNAITHSRSGSTISIVVNEMNTGLMGRNGRVNVNITNMGPVISKEELPHLFDRFYKSRNNDKESGKNFGLGLSIAKALADKNSFELNAKSENGMTTFTLSLLV